MKLGQIISLDMMKLEHISMSKFSWRVKSNLMALSFSFFKPIHLQSYPDFFIYLNFSIGI